MDSLPPIEPIIKPPIDCSIVLCAVPDCLDPVTPVGLCCPICTGEYTHSFSGLVANDVLLLPIKPTHCSNCR